MRISNVSLSVLLLGVLAFGACSKKEVKPEEGVVPNAMNADENSGDSDSGRAAGLKTVNFGYDAFDLSVEAKATLSQNAQILKEKANLKVQIEGHCDVRGGIQYNLALGEKRANAAKSFLVSEGITEDRVTTISFGKEKLLDNGSTEDAHAKNRRGNFVITSK
jgi:peptidoglycan-associated lipoprotein